MRKNQQKFRLVSSLGRVQNRFPGLGKMEVLDVARQSSTAGAGKEGIRQT